MSQISLRLAHCKTVEEVIAELQEIMEQHGPDTKVLFAYNYGDRPKTQVAETITKVELDYVGWSQYHNMPRIGKDDDEDAEREQVIILR